MSSHQVALSVSGNFFVVTPLDCVPAVSQGEFHAHPNHSSHQSEDGFAYDPPDLPQSGAVLSARRPPRRRRIHSKRPIRSGADRREHRADRLRFEGGPGRNFRNDQLCQPRLRNCRSVSRQGHACGHGRRASKLYASGSIEALRCRRGRRSRARDRQAARRSQTRRDARHV